MSIKEDILNIVYPRRCAICDKVVASNKCICKHCEDKPCYIRDVYCLKCGKQISINTDELCSDCKKNSHYFSYGACVFLYDSCMRESLMKFKYSARPEYARYYGREMMRLIYERKIDFDLIVPVPLHRRRYIKRGYNQAEELAKVLSTQMSIPYINALKRVRKTLPSKSLTRQERRLNLKNAFKLEYDISGYNILLVDDIYTTGATIDLCSMILRKGDAKSIKFIAVATAKE